MPCMAQTVWQTVSFFWDSPPILGCSPSQQVHCHVSLMLRSFLVLQLSGLSSGRLAFLSLSFHREEASSCHPCSKIPLSFSSEAVVPWISYYSGFPFIIIIVVPLHLKSKSTYNHKHARRKHQLMKTRGDFFSVALNPQRKTIRKKANSEKKYLKKF